MITLTWLFVINTETLKQYASQSLPSFSERHRFKSWPSFHMQFFQAQLTIITAILKGLLFLFKYNIHQDVSSQFPLHLKYKSLRFTSLNITICISLRKFVRTNMKQYLPFVTWWRNNCPLWLDEGVIALCDLDYFIKKLVRKTHPMF